MVNPVILFEPDGYALDGPKLMGRQAAGHGFLRAFVKACSDEPLVAYTPYASSWAAFRRIVGELDPAAQTLWMRANRLELLGDRGVFYRPDIAIGVSAHARLRAGIDHYSICGVTHTLSSKGAMRFMTDLLTAPMAPWDAVICTSRAAVDVIEGVWARQADYLRWRLGGAGAPPRPQLPLIPLGVHSDDFALAPGARAAARDDLGLAEDEVVALFAGRLSLSGKAHPYAMQAALQEVARRTGRKLVLIQAGKFFNASVETTYRTGAAEFSPDVRSIFVDGADFARYRSAWAAADLFVSLSDNIQETFGLTPLEAMAAGLPVVVTDWNGYKDTVRDGVDGFRIPTWAPEPGQGEGAARAYEVLSVDYDHYLSRASTAVVVEMKPLVECLTQLTGDADLRRRMGEAGRARVRETFDWNVILPQYKALWTELSEMRQRLRQDPAIAAWVAAAPKASPDFPDPFSAFANYPTGWVSLATTVRRRPAASADAYARMTDHQYWVAWKSPPEFVGQFLEAMGEQGVSVGDIARRLSLPAAQAIDVACRLAKMDLAELVPPGPDLGSAS